jgi:hypothetical protein
MASNWGKKPSRASEVVIPYLAVWDGERRTDTKASPPPSSRYVQQMLRPCTPAPGRLERRRLSPSCCPLACVCDEIFAGNAYAARLSLLWQFGRAFSISTAGLRASDCSRSGLVTYQPSLHERTSARADPACLHVGCIAECNTARRRQDWQVRCPNAFTDAGARARERHDKGGRQLACLC